MIGRQSQMLSDLAERTLLTDGRKLRPETSNPASQGAKDPGRKQGQF